MSATARQGAGATAGSAVGSPLVAAGLILAAVVGAFGLLLQAGRLSWPPHELLASAFVVSGCLGLVGPLILFRRGGGGGVGELVWFACGLTLWLFNLAGALREGFRLQAWATPLSGSTLGLVALAVMIAGWRLSSHGGKGWTWTNVAGWALGWFWVGHGCYSLFAA